MLYKLLNKSDYKEFLTNLISNYEVIGPKKINSAVHDFTIVDNADEIDISYRRTTVPPAKKILFPSYESLVSYDLTGNIKITPVIESRESVLYGVSPWDINGMNFLDRIFTTDFIDENYMAKRKRLTVIGFDTEPSDSNFALTVGADYARQGFDLFLTELKESFFIRVLTARGASMLEKYAKTVEAGTKDFKSYNEFMDSSRKKFKVKVDIKDFHDNFETVYFKNDLWDKLSKNCFSCGSCNLTCPTCFCFNVRDDMMINLKEGIKSRQWDSCMIPDYGLVAGGHNFRPSNSSRLKQRYRCKLKTFVDKFGYFSCVGCGWCVEACLAKINIYEDINSIKKEVTV